MSAKGHNSTVRLDRDSYPTPRSAFPDEFITQIGDKNSEIFEPCMGDGRLVTWLRAAGYGRAHGTDITLGHDFLADKTPREIVLTNPPFSLGFEIVQHAVRHSEETYLLLPLNFLGSQNRRPWYRENPVSALFVLSARPSFVTVVTCVYFAKEGVELARRCDYRSMLPVDSDRPSRCPKCNERVRITSSDSTEYAWYYWGKRHRGIFHL